MTGNSGATIEFTSESVVTKRVYRSQWGRIAASRQMQDAAACGSTQLPARLAAPMVREYGDGWFSMDRVRGVHPFVAPMEWMQDVISYYIIRNLRDAKMAFVSGDVFLSRLSLIESARLGGFFGREISDCQEAVKNGFWMPVGEYHGDLTLCNTIWDGERLFLFDFTPQLAPSPLFDLVKIRQDTQHGWFRVVGEGWTGADMKTVLSWDKGFRRIAEAETETKTFRAMEKLNILRIVPYATTNKIFHWIKEAYGSTS